MGPSGRFTHVIVILMFGTCYMQVLYLGRAPRTKDVTPQKYPRIFIIILLYIFWV